MKSFTLDAKRVESYKISVADSESRPGLLNVAIYNDTGQKCLFDFYCTPRPDIVIKELHKLGYYDIG